MGRVTVGGPATITPTSTRYLVFCQELPPSQEAEQFEPEPVVVNPNPRKVYYFTLSLLVLLNTWSGFKIFLHEKPVTSIVSKDMVILPFILSLNVCPA